MGNDAIVTAEDLARTYDGGAAVDAWQRVEQYHEAMRYRSKHPNKGSSAMASALDMPRGRIRSWLNGSKPDAVRAIETARDCNWIEIGADHANFEPLNALVANVFSSGSIGAENYMPSFVLDPTRRQLHIVDALDAIGIEYEIVDDRDGRTDEARPSTDGTVLGRVLACMGAPVGSKADQRVSLPSYLDDAPGAIRETFVRCYLENRATEYNEILKFREERGAAYLRGLAALIEDVTGGEVTVSEKNIHLSRAATDGVGLR